MNTRAALLLALWPMVAWGDVTAYRIVNLTPAGFSSSAVGGINNRGQIVGSIEPELGVYRAATWVRGRPRQLSDAFSMAAAINNRGQIFGTVTDAAAHSRIVRWWGADETVVGVGSPSDQAIHLIDVEGGRVVLGSADYNSGAFNVWVWANGRTTEVTGLPAPIFDTSWAFPQLRDMNGRGQIVGDGPRPFFGGSAAGAFVWQDGVTTALPSLDGRVGTSVSAINRRGQIAGNSSAADGTASHPVIWYKGRVRDLGMLPGAAFARTQNTKRAQSDNGKVIGFAISADFASSRAWIWEDGHMTDLGNLGSDFIQPYAVNNRGQVVGYGMTADNELHAFVWERGHISDLGHLGGGESLAFDINDRGDIIGESRAADHTPHAVLWTTRGW